jgi:anaerobic magnesium-protoporphyrin IX monomethyl ester cyclase
MKILISHSYFLYLDPKEALNKKPYPPLASLTMAAWIKEKLNTDAVFYDVMFDRNENGLVKKINDYKPDVFILYDDDFNFLTKMCLENMRNAIFRMMKKINKNSLFISHGSDVSDHAEKYLKAGFDIVAHRNAEKTIVEILKRFFTSDRLFNVNDLPGISYHSESGIKQNQDSKINFDPEETPLPCWNKISLSPYRELWIKNHGYFSLNVSTSHGCPYGCNWCAKPLYGRTYKVIPARRTARQFAYIKNQLKADHIWVTDDIFALKHGWIKEFADELERLNIKIPYKCLSRPDLINEGFVLELKRSGCDEVWLGVESGSQKILDAMDKGLKYSDTINANLLLKKYGIKVGFFLQYGYPGEDISDIKQTLKIIRECLPDHIGISVSYPLKGTLFYERVVSEMGEKRNWTDSADLALMFPGKYPPDFYRALHQFTHHYFGIVSIVKKQSLGKRLKRVAALYKHLPGIIKYKLLMNRQIILNHHGNN